MKERTVEEMSRDWVLPSIPEDAELRVQAALLRADPPRGRSMRKEFEQMRKQILGNPALMKTLREGGYLDE
jgi:hypothetical protein